MRTFEDHLDQLETAKALSGTTPPLHEIPEARGEAQQQLVDLLASGKILDQSES
jgi:hypothetical protein